MSIATRLEAIEEHLTDDYSVLELAGADLTNVDKNIVNLKPTWKERLLYFINNGTDIVWDNWEKVVGEGTELTLSNTEQAPMKVLLKGNTYQDSTTGKNLLNLGTLSTETKSGITFTPVYENGELQYINVNGTATENVFYNMKKTTFPAGSYIISGCMGGNTNTYALCINFSLGRIYQFNGDTAFTLDEERTMNECFIRIGNGQTVNNVKFYPMIRLSTVTDATYEPYTNGASPNPDYPQDIHVVSGDNTIKVEGKNLFNINNDYNSVNYGTYNVNGNELIVSSNSITDPVIGVYQIINVKPNTDYMLTGNLKSGLSTARLAIQYKTTESNNWENYSNIKTGVGTFNQSINTGNYAYIRLLFYWCTSTPGTITPAVFENIMLELGNQATTYEPYVSSSYQVNLPVENILPINQITSQTINGLTITNLEDGTIKVNGTTNATTRLDVTYSKTLKANTTYTWHNFNTRSSGANVNIQDSSDNVLSNIVLNASSGTYTPTTNVTIAKMRFYIDSNQAFDNYILKVQLEEGTKQNSFTPYGTTPIELCKIGTYQDRFIRNSGKNFFDINSEKSDFSASIYKYEYNLKPNTQYTISSNCPSSNTANIYANSTNSTKKVHINNPQTITSDSNGYFYILVRRVATSEDSGTFNVYQAILDGRYWLQIEEGNSATDYESYGNGEWYLNKQIGKVVLDGSEGWTSYTDLGTNARMYYQLGNILYRSPGYSNYFSVSSNWTDDITNVCLTPYQASLVAIKMPKSYLTTTDLQGMKNWLGTHNTIVYYVLATPTYTKIEGTLASQLEAVYRAKSEEGQTNISQTNDDLPFVLDVSALSKE